MSKVCIFSNSADTHVDNVIPYLERANFQITKFNADCISDNYYFRYDSLTDEISINIKNQKFTPDDFSVIWYRKPDQWWRYTLNPLINKDVDALHYKTKETKQLIQHFISQCREKNIPVICDPINEFRANEKINQLKLAKKLGFIIPKTLISSNRKEIKKFISENKSTVIKTLKNHELRTLTSEIFTFILTPENFIKLTKNSQLDYPLFLQENIEKKLELRITVIGDHVLAASIDSQAQKYSKTDWRVLDPDCMIHKKFDLPGEIKSKCLKLLKIFNLYFGAIDMAITPDGKYVFFEINPFGQYQWIEDFTGLPISKAIADLIIELSNHN